MIFELHSFPISVGGTLHFYIWQSRSNCRNDKGNYGQADNCFHLPVQLLTLLGTRNIYYIHFHIVYIVWIGSD